MTRTTRTARVLTSLSTVVIASLAVTAPAYAAPADGQPGGADPEYAESIQLSWDGQTYTATTEGTFFDDPVVVPGDADSRTLQVRNDGPTAGTLRASIVNVQILDPDAPDVHHNPDHPDQGSPYGGAGDQGNFYDDLTVSWHDGAASFTELSANGATEFLQVPLDEGEEVPITLGYSLGYEATSGNQANVDPRLATFDVLLEIGGELPAEIPEDPAEAGPPGLQETGISGIALLLALGAIAVGTGIALRLSARYRAPNPGL